jgi:CBS domain-containing protein
MYVLAILKSKDDQVATIEPESSIANAIRRLRGRGVGSLIVSTDGETIQGIISERDVLRGLAQLGGPVLDRTVAEFMTPDVITCHPSDDAERVMSLMTENRIRHLPVVQAGRLVGIISIGDVVKAVLNETRSEAEAMRSYIVAGA